MGTTLFNLAKEKFDLFAFLDENGIDYALHGKNIGDGFLGIYECPHCGIGNYHYGINIQEKFGTCWSCAMSDDLVNIIKHLLEINYYEAKDYLISSVYSEEDIEVQVNEVFNKIEPEKKEKKQKKIKQLKTTELYKYIGINGTVTRFCKERKITKSLAKWLDLQISIDKKWRNHLLIPVNYNGDMVGYQIRNFTTRFFHNEGPLKHHLFNYNNIKKRSKIILVEGITDWTSTYNFISKYRKNQNYAVTTPFSKLLTEEQIKLLENIDPEIVIFMLDYDAWFQYYKPSHSLFCDTDFLIVPKDSDPGNMSTSQFLKLFIGHEL